MSWTNELAVKDCDTGHTLHLIMVTTIIEHNWLVCKSTAVLISCWLVIRPNEIWVSGHLLPLINGNEDYQTELVDL